MEVKLQTELNSKTSFLWRQQNGRSSFKGYFCFGEISSGSNRPFPSSPGPLFQNEVQCSALDMEMIFHSHANKTHFNQKGCALGLILKVRVFETRKWPIIMST